MAGVNQGNTEQVGETHTNITGIRIMAVYEIRPSRLLIEPIRQVVHEAVEMVPQLLLGNIFLGTGINADDPGFFRKCFDGNGVVLTDRLIDDPACDQVDLGDPVMFCECLGDINNVLGLAAGIGIPAKLKIMGPDQTVDTDEYDVF